MSRRVDVDVIAPLIMDTAVRFPETGGQENRHALKLADGTWRWSEPVLTRLF